MTTPLIRSLIRTAAAPYRPAGRFAWHFALGKLTRDPVFRILLQRGLIPDGSRILDLGCGQGLLAAWLHAAGKRHKFGEWWSDWPAPPDIASYHGIELMPSDARRARVALGPTAKITCADIRAAALESSDTIVILDVIHFLDPAAQVALLSQCLAALPATGVLLLRIGDADGGWRFKYSVSIDRLVALCRGHRLNALHCRSHSDWVRLLTDTGYEVETIRMTEGPLFANVLFIARPRPAVPANGEPANPADGRRTPQAIAYASRSAARCPANT